MFFSIHIPWLDASKQDISDMAEKLDSEHGVRAVEEAKRISGAFSSIKNRRGARFYFFVAKELKRRHVLARAPE